MIQYCFRRWVAAVYICLGATVWAQDSATPAGIHWYTNYEEARAEARRTEKPIFLEFRCAP